MSDRRRFLRSDCSPGTHTQLITRTYANARFLIARFALQLEGAELVEEAPEGVEAERDGECDLLLIGDFTEHAIKRRDQISVLDHAFRILRAEVGHSVDMDPYPQCRLI